MWSGGKNVILFSRCHETTAAYQTFDTLARADFLGRCQGHELSYYEDEAEAGTEKTRKDPLKLIVSAWPKRDYH